MHGGVKPSAAKHDSALVEEAPSVPSPPPPPPPPHSAVRDSKARKTTIALAAARAARDEIADIPTSIGSAAGRHNPCALRDPHALLLRPTLAVVRERFKQGYVVSEAELDAMSEENALHAAVDKLEVTQLRERREEGDESLTAADVDRIEKADAEKARILALATKMAASWGVKEQGETSFDPFGRSGGKYG